VVSQLSFVEVCVFVPLRELLLCRVFVHAKAQTRKRETAKYNTTIAFIAVASRRRPELGWQMIFDHLDRGFS
jgi:hypothetical protein